MHKFFIFVHCFWLEIEVKVWMEFEQWLLDMLYFFLLISLCTWVGSLSLSTVPGCTDTLLYVSHLKKPFGSSVSNLKTFSPFKNLDDLIYLITPVTDHFTFFCYSNSLSQRASKQKQNKTRNDCIKREKKKTHMLSIFPKIISMSLLRITLQ